MVAPSAFRYQYSLNMQTVSLKNGFHAKIDRRLWLAYGLLWLLIWSLFYLSNLQTDLSKGQWRPWLAFYNATLTLWPAVILGGLPWVCNWFAGSGLGWWARQIGLGLVFSLCWLGLNTLASYLLNGPEFCMTNLRETFLWQSLWGYIVYAGLVAALHSLLTARQSKANAVAAVEADSARVKAELSAIRGKLNPHFLFNTLNTLVILTRQDPKQAEALLLRFSGMLRYILDSQREQRDRVTLSEELEFARDFLDLEQVRFGARLKVNWQIDDACLNDELPILTLQPLIENSIAHGISPSIRGGTVTIKASRESGQLALTVSDDGIGTDLSMDSKRKGIGLSALRQRFALDYNGQAQFSLTSQPGQGFTVKIVIPK
jgi:signal transduction histidine kinase